MKTFRTHAIRTRTDECSNVGIGIAQDIFSFTVIWQAFNQMLILFDFIFYLAN